MTKDEILGQSNKGLLGQIKMGGLPLKKTETIEKTGLDYIKKNSIVTNSTNTLSSGKSDLFSQIKNAQLKKGNK